ncbi:hypothetical protein T439DRAFT_51886 [Meredithblackwellia eburnea MCA 4105]
MKILDKQVQLPILLLVRRRMALTRRRRWRVARVRPLWERLQLRRLLPNRWRIQMLWFLLLIIRIPSWCTRTRPSYTLVQLKLERGPIQTDWWEGLRQVRLMDRGVSSASPSLDSIQAYGATATNAGPYGCSVDSDPLLTDWWQAQGSSNWFSAYQGACRIAGIGYGKHVFTMINSPNDPGTLYFTGLHYTKNQSQQPWSQPIIEGCCREYDFPAGATTTISSGSESSVETGAGNSTTSGATTPAKSTNYVTIVTVALAALALTAIAALLVGCLCCRKTSDPPPPEDAFASALADEKEPLRKKKKKKHHVHKRKKSASSKRSSTSSASATDTASTGTDSDQRKSGGRRRRGKKSKKSDDDDDDATDTD